MDKNDPQAISGHWEAQWDIVARAYERKMAARLAFENALEAVTQKGVPAANFDLPGLLQNMERTKEDFATESANCMGK